MKSCGPRVPIPWIGASTVKLAGMSETISALAVTNWVNRAATLLEESQAEINRINVFPIADSDTGSNMAHTVRAACEELQSAVDEGTLPEPEDATDANLPTITALLATGAVKGARGNSGMVLSQVFRALADASAQGPIDAAALVRMLRDAVGFAESTIAAPVEGTILTVLRQAANGASTAHEAGEGMSAIVGASLDAAREALFDTPNQLEVLAEAGVYDAGGAGFILMLEALKDVLTGKSEGTAMTGSSTREHEAPGGDSASGTHAESHGVPAELELLFFFHGDVDPLREVLATHGDSIVIAPVSEEQAKVHVHTLEAGALLEKAFGLGQVTELRIEVLPSQPGRLATAPRRASRPIIALVTGHNEGEKGAVGDSGEGDEQDIFAAVGAISLDPVASEEQTRTALEQLPDGDIAVLTNGADPAAILEVAQREGSGRQLNIIDTDSLVGGLAALAVFDPTNDWEDNTADMLDASASQRWWQGPPEQLPQTVADLLADGGELVTFITSDLAVADAVEAFVHRAREQHPGVEFHEHHARGLGAAVQVGVE